MDQMDLSAVRIAISELAEIKQPTYEDLHAFFTAIQAVNSEGPHPIDFVDALQFCDKSRLRPWGLGTYTVTTGSVPQTLRTAVGDNALVLLGKSVRKIFEWAGSVVQDDYFQDGEDGEDGTTRGKRENGRLHTVLAPHERGADALATQLALDFCNET